MNQQADPVNADNWPQTVAAWLVDALPFAAPFTFELVAAGGSNLTYIGSSDCGKQFVVRRPPLRARLATAHDMQREFRIIEALQGSAVPVPAMLAWCDDRTVCDVDFYCMTMVTGLVIRDQASSAAMSSEDCLRATRSLVDAQVAFHTIDLEQVGLTDLGKHDGYLQRQLKRWTTQVQKAAARDVPEFSELHDFLSERIPAAAAQPGLAHGDYRFDNTIINPDFSLAAVLDWELCTIGDPIADFIWSLNYWAQPDDPVYWLLDPPTLNPAFPDRRQVIDLYQQGSGFDVEQNMAWYQAFSWWKQACIVEGVYARMLKGAGGGMKTGPVEQIAERVMLYLREAQRFASRV